MITEVVIGVAKQDVKCHSVIEFTEIFPYNSTPTKDEIIDVKIAVTCAAAGLTISAGEVRKSKSA